MLTVGEKVENGKEWNNRQSEGRVDLMMKGIQAGCIDTWACENCNHLVTDPTCLCTKSFICPNCGYDEKPNVPEELAFFVEQKENPVDWNKFKDGWASGSMECMKCNKVFNDVRFRYSCHDKVEGLWPVCCGDLTKFCSDWKPEEV